MPHSPYTKTFHAPRCDLDDCRDQLITHRREIDEGDRENYRDQELCALSEELLEYADFLDEKLSLRTNQYKKLLAKSQNLEEENAELKKKLENLRTVVKPEEQNGANELEHKRARQSSADLL
ncbi:MAG: hypothetical protein Q9219_005734 [cf. Caloplaca sp. 3 TL-2023]